MGRVRDGAIVPAGSYGGRSGYNNTPPLAFTYGSVLNPTDLGSGSFGHNTPPGGRPGGGALWINVGCVAQVDGVITAGGYSPGRNNEGGGAGGSILLQTATITGKGTICANGGQDTWHGSGGGGRIAMVLTQSGANFNSFTGTVSALGANLLDAAYTGSGAGTIYRQAGSDAAGFGTVTVSNGWNVTGLCYLPPSIGGSPENMVGTAWRVEYLGKLGITTNNYVIRGMTLVGTNSVMDMGSNVLVVVSNLVVNGTNFPVGGYSAAQINAKAGTTQVKNGGYVSVGGGPVVETWASTNANLQGYLMATGTAATTVYLYWGDTDYGTNKNLWYTNTVLAAPQVIGSLSVPVSAPFAHVYYRFYATNAAGDHWATTNGLFQQSMTLTASAPVPTASKQPYAAGQFQISRVDTSASVAVNYSLSGTLSNGLDYVWLTNALTMNAGQSNATINVLPLGRWYNSDQTVILSLGAGSYGVGSPNSATVTVSGTAAPAGTNTWLGGTPTLAGSWSMGHVPANTDNILLGGWGAQADLVWDASMPHTVASWVQTRNYTNTVTLMTTYPNYSTVFTNFAISGNLTIDGGTWRHAANSNTNAYRLAVTVGSDFTLGTNGALNVNTLGYTVGNGPGKGTNPTGGSHAGTGGHYWSTAYPTAYGVSGPTYGSVLMPIDLGSGPGALSGIPLTTNFGGGAISLVVGGTSLISGTIAANSAGAFNNGGGGAGGSIYLRTATISGTGSIQANGGQDTQHGSGGGGRVALVLTQPNADFNSFAGIASALGGNNQNGYDTGSGAGTVYRQSGSDSQGCGTVSVSNLAWSFNTSVSNLTCLPVTGGTMVENLTGTSWRVEGNGKLGISANNGVIRGLTLAGANGLLDLSSNVLVTLSNLVVNGANFPAGGYSAAQINAKAGTTQVKNGGYVSVGGGPIVETWASTNTNLKGSLMATGTAATTVFLYWGDSDGGTNKSAWYTNTVLTAPQVIGPLSVPVSVLSPDIYYRYYATNAVGDHWATTNGVFHQGMTLSVQAQDPVACKQPYDPGQFQISRTDTSMAIAVSFMIGRTLSNGLDYIWLTNALTMNAGQGNAVINVLPLGRWYTNDQTVTLTLASGGYTIGAPNSATVTVTGTAAPTGTNTWLGGTPTLASSWSMGHVPANTDNILLGGWGAQADLVWDASMSHTVASWVQTRNYTNTVTLMTTYPNYSTAFTNFAISGNLTIDGGTWRHAANSNTNAYRLAVTVGGNLSLASNTAFNLTGLGYYVNNGPGTGTGSNGRGASYGGKGGYYSALPGPTYGSVFEPVDLGSGGGELVSSVTNFGGGAGWINVSGTASVYGAISADGMGTCNSGGGGSGGSIYLRVGRLLGTGAVRANGGNDTWHGSGGGGRVSVVLTQAEADFNSFAGAIVASGNGTNGYAVNYASQGSAAGTVYLRSGIQPVGYGTVIVSNVQWAAGTTSRSNCTHLPPMTQFTEDLTNTTWIAQNGLLQLTTNMPFRKLILNAGSGLELSGYTVTVVDLVITNRVYSPGIYTTNTLGTTMVTGNGTIIVLPVGLSYFIF